ncbi:hypothetical protein [Nitrosococcus oceani]|nr:hypothetical protein [Nitrosococcus oceani]
MAPDATLEVQSPTQAIYDMVNDSAKERVVNKRKIWEMRHQAGIRF